MCGPLKVWKGTIYVLSILFVGIGIALTIVAVVASNKKFIKAVEVADIVRWYGIAFGVVIMFIGLLGWTSAKYECRCLVCIVIFIVIS